MVEEPAVEPVLGHVPRVAPDGELVTRDSPVQGDVGELHAPEPEDARTVGVGGRVRRRVVAAMHRDPFPRAHAGGDPKQHATEEHGWRAHRQRAVGEGAVEVHRRRDDRDLGHDEARQHGNGHVHRWLLAV